VTGVGACLPERVLTNAELGEKLGKDDNWILTRTGIRERRFAADNEFTSDLALRAAERALRRANPRGDRIDLIIVATSTPDMMFPATACLVQARLGARRAAAFDLKAGGSGFLCALEIGRQFVMTHAVERVLVIGAEKLSAVVDWCDPDTCVLFGDGAGAIVLEHRPNSSGLLVSSLGSDGHGAKLLYVPGGGSRVPASYGSVTSRLHFLRMDGRKTFKQAVQVMCRATRDALDRNNLSLSQIRCIIPHQSNRRITEAFAERLGASPEQFFVNLERQGNTSAASVPIALDEAVETGRIRRGDLVLLTAFGGGLTWGATVIEW
jgi:3-oxoacyl-[acyl-carrier-protein] synthase III